MSLVNLHIFVKNLYCKESDSTARMMYFLPLVRMSPYRIVPRHAIAGDLVDNSWWPHVILAPSGARAKPSLPGRGFASSLKLATLSTQRNTIPTSARIMRFLSEKLLPCLLLTAGSVVAVFKDDAYHTDWHVPLIGAALPASTFFHRPNVETRASLVYTLTRRSILAAINPKDGELVWRQQLPESEPAGTSLARPGNGVVVSAVGSRVACFNAGNGRLVWENRFAQDTVDLAVTAENAVAALFGDGTVRLLAEQSGDVVWEWKGLDRCCCPPSHCHFAADSNLPFCVQPGNPAFNPCV